MKEEHILKIDGVNVKVIIQTAKRRQNRIVKYGAVLSFSGGEKFYDVKKLGYGTNRFGYSCKCDDNWNRGRICKHIAAFKLAEGAK